MNPLIYYVAVDAIGRRPNPRVPRLTLPVYPPELVAFGVRVRDLRERLCGQMPLSEAARRLGITGTGLALIEMGGARVTDETAAIREMERAWRTA